MGNATQSIREIFRKLASALHPDRETDRKGCEVKTALILQVNRAYAGNDLLTLLELQIEQVDASHIARGAGVPALPVGGGTFILEPIGGAFWAGAASWR